MSRLFRRIFLCGCSSNSRGIDGQKFVVDESVVEDGPKSIEFSASDEHLDEDIATHFDLSTIKFIDEEEEEEETDDEEVAVFENGITLCVSFRGRKDWVHLVDVNLLRMS